MEPVLEDIDLAPIPRRAFAFGLDAAILFVLVLMLGSLGESSGAGLGAVVPVMIAMGAIYNIGFIAAAGATPGKTAFGLRVVNRDGERPGPDTAVLRFLVYFAFGAVFPIGTIANVASMFADERRRTFADRIAGTTVVEDGG
jgi:uncharacterized RDD family membrane protein YckC